MNRAQRPEAEAPGVEGAARSARPLLGPARPPPAAAGGADPGRDRRGAVPARRRLGKPAEPVLGPTGNAPAEEASLTVLPAEPGLREPPQTAAGLAPKDPFRPHYTAPVFNKGAAPTSGTSTSTSTSTSASSTTTNPAPEGSVEGGASPPPAPESSGGGAPATGGGGSEGQSTKEVRRAERSTPSR